jgi:two-component system response regulator YesN
MVRLSPDHLERLFKKEVGTSIGRYAMELRLQRASKLLESTFRSIEEIRDEVGIPDGSNFVRHFKNRFGVTPSAYRKALHRF